MKADMMLISEDTIATQVGNERWTLYMYKDGSAIFKIHNKDYTIQYTINLSRNEVIDIFHTIEEYGRFS